MEQLVVSILDREYRLAVTPEDKARLLDAVGEVDARMRSIRDAGRVTGTERMAVMAALQLAHELLESKAGGGSPPADNGESVRRIRRMTEALDAEMKRQENLF